jgi:hypothetical protein
MTIKELRARTAPISVELALLAEEAEADDFAPWVVTTLREASFKAELSEAALADAKGYDTPESVAEKMQGVHAMREAAARHGIELN